MRPTMTVESAIKRGVELARSDTYRIIDPYGSEGGISIGPIGKRNRIIHAFRFRCDGVIRVRAGCFHGTLDEFASAVIRKYGDDRAEYDAAIKLINAKLGSIE